MDDATGKYLQLYAFDDFIAGGGEGGTPSKKENQCVPGSAHTPSPTERPAEP